MSQVKIEHVDPLSGKSVAFDIMAGDEVKDTFALRHGEFRLFNLSGGLMLHEVSMGELAERERKAREDAELEAEVARERKAKEDFEHAEKVKADRDAKKAEIEAEAAKQDKAAADDASAEKSHDATFGDNWKPEQSRPADPVIQQSEPAAPQSEVAV